MDTKASQKLRALPSVDALLHSEQFVPLLKGFSHAKRVRALRQVLASTREKILAGDLEATVTAEGLAKAIEEISTYRLKPLINATGVVLHTNLGRAPLADEAIAHLVQAAASYTNLEFDLASGERGSRMAVVEELLTDLTSAEAALVVNNNAAAVLLTLAALGPCKEVIVSRGELVEIGGAFRIPDVMTQSGARLVEVGTTNRTRLADYERAVGPETALLMKVHRSNFVQLGFVEEASTVELAALSKRHKVPLFEDLGSGLLLPIPLDELASEPTVKQKIQQGADLVCFSGDKLLGGPQAGIVVGRSKLIAALKAHPLMRALRADKLCLAALEATLTLYRDQALDRVPAYRLLCQTKEEILRRATALQALLSARGVSSAVEQTQSLVGGGAMPLTSLLSYACVLKEAEPLEQRLRASQPAVIARVHRGSLLLDLRCVEEESLPLLAEAVAAAAGQIP